MDNKRWYSRFGTIFWWSLAILPLIVVLIQFIGYHLTFNSGITSATELANYHSNVEGDFFTIFIKCLSNGSASQFSSYSLPFINDMFVSLFEVLSDGEMTNELPYLLAWMTSVAFYHVLFDFSVWIFNWIHLLFERWGCFK